MCQSLGGRERLRQMFAPGFPKCSRGDSTRCAQLSSIGRMDCSPDPPELRVIGKALHIHGKTEKLSPLPDHIFFARLRHDAQLRLSASRGHLKPRIPAARQCRAFGLLQMLRSFDGASPAMSVPGCCRGPPPAGSLRGHKLSLSVPSATYHRPRL